MGAYADLLPDSDTPAKKTSLSSSSVTPNVAAFVEQYAPIAERVAEKTGNDPSLYLAQWGLETGWGKSVIPGTNNLGNIKDFSGRGITAKDNHTGSVDKYRQYDTPDAFADDFAGLLGRRYKSALNVGNDMEAFAHELKRNGYAEDPSYVAKLKAAHSMVSGRIPEKKEPTANPNSRGEFEPQTDYSAAFERFAKVPDSTLQAQIAADSQPKEDDGFFGSMGRGFKSTLPQTKQLLSGAGALVADTLGFEDARDYLMESYANAEKDVQALSKPTDSWSDQGSKNLGNFVGYWTGYMGGQIAESMAAALAGGAVGTTAGGAGAVPGALGAVILKTEAKAAIAKAAQTMAEAATKKALEKGLTKEAATLEAKQVADAFVKTATQRAVGRQIGVVGGMGVQNFGMETGEIYGDLYQKAKREGREVTDEERTDAWLYGTLAGAMETVADKFNLDAIMGGGAKGAGLGKRLAGFAREAGKAELRENATELVQTGLERAGKGEEVNPFLGTPESEKAYNEYVDTVAGTTAGSWIPGLGGLRVAQQQKAKQDAAAQQAPKPNSPLENAAKAAGAVPLLGHDPSVLNPLEQNIGPAPLEGEWMPADGGEKPALESPSAMTDRKGQVIPSESRFTMGEGEAPSTAKGFRQRSEKTIAGLLNMPRAMLTQQQQQVVDQSLVEYEAAYQDLVKADQLGASDQELMQRQINLRNAEARLQELNQLIEANRQVSTTDKRDDLLNRVLASNPQNPNRAFDRALRLEGFNDLNFTEAEKAKIARFGELRQMPDEGSVGTPNEGGDFGIKAKPEQAATQANQNVANMLNAGWQLQGKQLVSPKGEKYNLKAGELLFVRNKLQQKAKPTGDRVAPQSGVVPSNELGFQSVGTHETPNGLLTNSKFIGNSDNSSSTLNQSNNAVSRDRGDSSVTGNSVGENTVSLDEARNRAWMDVEAAGNLLSSHTSSNEWIDRLNPQEFGVVQRLMLIGRANDKILKPIIKSIPVDVMNMLVGKKISPEMLFNDPSMLKNVFSSRELNDSVPFVVNPAAGIVSKLASVIAIELTSNVSGDLVIPSEYFRATSKAFNSWHDSNTVYKNSTNATTPASNSKETTLAETPILQSKVDFSAVGDTNEGRQEQPVLQTQDAEPVSVPDQGQAVSQPAQVAENVPGTAQAPNVTEPKDKTRYAVGLNNTVIEVQAIHDVTYPELPGRDFFTRQTDDKLFNVVDTKSGQAVFLDAATEEVAIANFAVRMQQLGLDRVKKQLESLPDVQVPKQETDDERAARIKATKPADRDLADVEWYNNRSKAEAVAEQPKPEAEIDLRGFTDGMPKIKAGKAKTVLKKQVSNNGVFRSRKDIVDEAIDGGGRVDHSTDGRRLVKKNGDFITESDLGSTALDYAEHLLASAKAETPAVKFSDAQQLGPEMVVPYYLQEIQGTEKGVVVPNPKFVLGEVSQETSQEIAKYIDGYDGTQRKLRISGRTIKHIEESRPKLANELVKHIAEFFVNPDEVLPDHKAVGKRALLVHLGSESTKLKHQVATVEVEIEVEVSDGFIDIVTVMTSPDRSLKQSRELKKNWREGQQIPEQAGYSPHPFAAEATHAEADLPNVPPVAPSIDRNTNSDNSGFVLPDGWEGAVGGIATKKDPVTGGIVDKAIASDEWFFVPNDEALETTDGFNTQKEAIEALEKAVSDRAKYLKTAEKFKEKQAERSIVPLDQITVTRTGTLDGKEVEYDQQADAALNEIDKQMTLGKQLLECLAS